MDPKVASLAIQELRSVLAEKVTARHYAEHPELLDRHGAAGKQRTLEDTHFNLSFLTQAMALGNPLLFTDYTAWLKVLLMRRKVRYQDIEDHFNYLKEALQEELETETAAMAGGYIDEALAKLPGMPEDLSSFIEGDGPISLLAHRYLQSLLRGDRKIASQLVLDAVATGTSVKDLYLGVFQPCQYEIGRLWQTNQISVAQEHFCTAATQLVMSQLYSHIFSTEKNGLTLVATCVAGDLHEIGIRMVADFFELDGWHTFYLGSNTPHAGVVATIVERHADVVAISATIPYHVQAVHDLTRAIRQDPSCRHVKILVGGHPFNRDPDLWRRIETDGSAHDARTAIHLANELVKERPK